jgi:hypothetical protein
MPEGLGFELFRELFARWCAGFLLISDLWKSRFLLSQKRSQTARDA